MNWISDPGTALAMLESFIARRYLSTRRKPLFVSFIFVISLSAVAVGVFALIFVLAVMNGFENDFRQRVLGFKAPLVVMSGSGEDLGVRAEEWKKLDPRIQRVVPFAEGEAVAQTEEGGALGIRIRGIGEAPSEKRLGRLYESEPFSEDSLVAGEGLADSLRVNPDLEEKIRLIFPIGDVGPTGELVPRVRFLRLTGLFHSGFYDFDSKYALVPYGQALRLFGREARTGLEIWLRSPDDAEEVKKVLQKKIEQLGNEGKSPYAVSDGISGSTDGAHEGRAATKEVVGARRSEIRPPLVLMTWRDQNPKLFAAMKLEKIGMFLLLGMLLLIASFNIFGLASLTVLDKVKDMAVLRSIGLSAGKVRKIFLVQAASIGGWGSAIGGGLGLLVTWLLRVRPVPLPSSYYLETLPVSLRIEDCVSVLLAVPVITTLAAFYPAQKASQVSPVEVLRYE